MNAVAELTRVVEQIDFMASGQRHAALIAFARSAWWTASLGLVEGKPGDIGREAARALLAELAAITPGKIWAETPYGHRRAAIFKALRIDRNEPGAGYATAAFRVVQTAPDETWIAGAVGCPPDLKGIAASLAWQHLDILDVVLWNPRTNAVRIMGEAGDGCVLPAMLDDRLTVYADGFAFFRAWADRRAAIAAAHIASRERKATIPPADAIDSGLPGALIIGDLNKVRWCDVGATVLIAGPGVDAKRLDHAVYRSARLPRVEAAPEQRRAA